jgi:hypothetical protein
MSKTTKHIPTFTLKWINIDELMKDFSKGVYNRKNHEKTSFKCCSNTLSVNKTYSESRLDGVYCEKDKNNIIVLASGNYKEYSHYKNFKTIKAWGKCNYRYCSKDLDDSYVGIPIYYQIKPFIKNEETVNIHIFHVIEKFCCFEHAWFQCLEERGKIFTHNNPYKMNSERLLKTFYKLIHPDGENIFNENVNNLLISNGGTLSDEELEKHKYIKTPRVKMLPTSEEYIKL